jgi:hypothetical protein
MEDAMTDMSKAEGRGRCPKCGAAFERGKQHHCGSGRGMREREELKKPAPSHEEIAKRAYELYVAGGQTPGHDFDDWLQAEHELCASAGQPH